MCLQLQLDNLVTDFQKVTEDLKRRFVVNGEPLIEEGMVVGGSPMGSGSFKRMTGFTLPQRPTMASSGEGERQSSIHTYSSWRSGQVSRARCTCYSLQQGIIGARRAIELMHVLFRTLAELQIIACGLFKLECFLCLCCLVVRRKLLSKSVALRVSNLRSLLLPLRPITKGSGTFKRMTRFPLPAPSHSLLSQACTAVVQAP